MKDRKNRFSVQAVPRKEMRRETAIKTLKSLVGADEGRSDNYEPEVVAKDEETEL